VHAADFHAMRCACFTVHPEPHFRLVRCACLDPDAAARYVEQMKAKCTAGQFIETWNKCGTIAEVAAALGMTRDSVMSRACRLRKLGHQLGKMRLKENELARLLRLATRVISPQGFSPQKGVNAKVDPADLEAFIHAVAEDNPDKDFVTDTGQAGGYFYIITNQILSVLHDPPWAAKPGDWDLVGLWAEKKKVSRSKAYNMLGLKTPNPKPKYKPLTS